MPIQRYKPEQIVTMLRQIEVSIANGKTTPQACKEATITVQTFYRWRKEYGGLKMDQAKRLKELEKENGKLKRLVAELALDKQILKDIAEGNLPAHHGAFAERGVGGGEGSSAADLATRRAEGAAETAGERAVVARGWLVHPVATEAGESCVELRFCEGDDARWAGTAHPGGDRRVYAGVFGVAGGAALGESAADRNVGGCDAGARDPRAHSFGQWAGVHCRGVAEVVRKAGYEDVVHRAGALPV